MSSGNKNYRDEVRKQVLKVVKQRRFVPYASILEKLLPRIRGLYTARSEESLQLLLHDEIQSMLESFVLERKRIDDVVHYRATGKELVATRARFGDYTFGKPHQAKRKKKPKDETD